jgi:translocation and assembly module TamB
MRRLRVLLFSLAILGGLASQGHGAVLPDLGNWGGSTLLDLLRTKIQGKITVGEISGNPFTGITYRDLVVEGPEGKVILQAQRLELRLSLWSIPTLHLEVASLALVSPQIYLTEEAPGRWSLGNLLKARETPAQPPGSLTNYLFRQIDFPDILVSKGEIVLTRRGATQRFTDLELQSRIALQNLNQPQQQIRVSGANLKVTSPQGRVEFDTRLTYGAGIATIDHLALRLAGQEVLSFKGEVGWPLTQLTCKMTGQWGPLKGSLLHEVWSRWPASWDLTGKFDFSSTPEAAQLTAQGGIGQASFVLKGQLDAKAQPAVFKMDAELKGLTAAQLQEIKGIDTLPIQGLTPVNGRLHLEGAGMPWNPSTMEARLDLEPFQYKEVKVNQTRLSLKGDARGQELQGSVAGNFGTVSLNSRGQLLPLKETGKGISGDLSLSLKEIQPSLWGWRRYPGTLINSNLSGKFRLPPSFSLAQVYLAGKLQANGRIGPEPLKDLQTSFVLEGRKLTLSQASIQMASLTATLRGTITEAGLEVTFAGTVSGARNLPLPPGAAFNYLQAQGSVRGTWQSPQWTGMAKVQKGSYGGVSIESASLTGNLAGWPPSSGALQLRATRLHTEAGAFARADLSAQGAGGSWQFQATATSPPQPRAELAGAIDLNSRPIAVAVDRFSWQGDKLTAKNKAPFQIRFSPGWEVSPATFQVNGGAVIFQGKARGGELSGVLEVRDLNAGLLQPAGVPAQGKLNGKLTLAGTPQAPVIDGRLALSGGRIRDYPLQTLSTTLSYQADRLKVAGSLEEGTAHARLTWKGTVPVRLSLLPPKLSLGDQGLDLRLQSDRLNLAVLTLLSPEVTAAEGSVELAVQAQGNPRLPQVSGYIRLGAGSFHVRRAGIPFKLAPVEFRLEGNKITIPGLVVTSDGTLTLKGDIYLSAPTRVAAKAQLDNFQVMNRGGNEIWSNGSVDISGPLTALVATGRLDVPKGQLRPTLFRTGMDPDLVLLPPKLPAERQRPAPSLVENMRIDVALESPGNVWLKDPKGKVEMQASLKVIKLPGQKIAFGGEIHALNGTVVVNEEAFKVVMGALRLPGIPGKPIDIEVKAIHEIDEITLVLTVSGTLSNPLIRLESEPSLPPADVLSYLAFGAPAATLTRDQYLALGVQQLGVLGGVTPNKLSEALESTIPFLGSGIKLKSGLVGGRSTLGVAKEITKNVSVTYGRNLNEERGQYERQVGVEYKINRHLSLDSQIGPRNSGADVLFNYDF